MDLVSAYTPTKRGTGYEPAAALTAVIGDLRAQCVAKASQGDRTDAGQEQ